MTNDHSYLLTVFRKLPSQVSLDKQKPKAT